MFGALDRGRRVLSAGPLMAVGLAAALSGLVLAGGCGAPAPGPGPGPGPEFETAAIFGEVLDATNISQGISNAYVYVPFARAVGVSARQEVIASDTTDAEGKYELPDVPTGTQVLQVDPPEGSSYGSFQIEFTVPKFVSRIRFVITLLPSTTTANSLTIRPANPTVAPGGRVQFAAQVTDAQGNIINVEPTWAVKGDVGIIDRDGLFTAGPTAGVQGQVIALAGGVVGSTNVQVSSGGATFNQAPTLDSVLASASTLYPGDTTTIKAKGVDPDNDPLSYTWETDGGSITGTGEQITWKAPVLRKTYRIICTVDDGKGGTAQKAAEVVVVNRFPTISQITADPTETSPGGQVTLSVAADDADGDSLSYTWEVSGGTISGFGATVRWTAPSDAGFYFTQVSVEDGLGGFAGAWVDLTVTDTQIIIMGLGVGERGR